MRLQRIAHNWVYAHALRTLRLLSEERWSPLRHPVHIISSWVHVPKDESNEYIFNFSFQLGESFWEEATKANIQSLNCFPLFRLDLLVSEDLGRNFSVLNFNPLRKQLFQNTEARVSLGCQHPLLTLPLQTFWSSLCFPTASNLLPPPTLFHPLLKMLGFFFFSPWILFSLGLGSSDRERDRESEQLREKLEKGEKIQAAKSWEVGS